MYRYNPVLIEKAKIKTTAQNQDYLYSLYDALQIYGRMAFEKDTIILDDMLDTLSLWGDMPLIVAAISLSRALLPIWEEMFPSYQSPRYAVIGAENWLQCAKREDLQPRKEWKCHREAEEYDSTTQFLEHNLNEYFYGQFLEEELANNVIDAIESALEVVPSGDYRNLGEENTIKYRLETLNYAIKKANFVLTDKRIFNIIYTGLMNWLAGNLRYYKEIPPRISNWYWRDQF